MNTTRDRLTLDGSRGEGGGQLLRTALGLSLATGRPFTITGIRAGRRRPGLMRQHLTCVLAARALGNATVQGAELGALDLTFDPGRLQCGTHRFAIGTAGSTTLVFQALLPALLAAPGDVTLELEGGTHNPMSPPYDFLSLSYLPQLRRMGAEVSCRLERHGFVPAGGGKLVIDTSPGTLRPLQLGERGADGARRVRALVANLPESIGRREVERVVRKLGWHEAERRIERCDDSLGPGNVLLLEIESEQVTEVIASFGDVGRRAERVADDAVKDAKDYLASQAPVGRQLADQLLVPLALAGGGRFRTLPPTQHTLSNAEMIERFLDVDIAITEAGPRDWWVTVEPR